MHIHAIERIHARPSPRRRQRAPLSRRQHSTSNTSEAAQVTVSPKRAPSRRKRSGVDEKKVAALKNQIEGGEYKVHPQMLAMRILDSIG